ncbi:hypothetical protein FQ187_23285 [Pseudomonas sp. ANT_J28]|nr:hypothetical protein FQ187_23285 [Pseudomonas sp. ANT_J28]
MLSQVGFFYVDQVWIFRCLGGPLREQARSHTRSPVSREFVPEADPMWERACSRRRSVRRHINNCQ